MLTGDALSDGRRSHLSFSSSGVEIVLPLSPNGALPATGRFSTTYSSIQHTRSTLHSREGERRGGEGLGWGWVGLNCAAQRKLHTRNSCV